MKDDLELNSAAAMIPHPKKVETGGEDAYFIDTTRWVGLVGNRPLEALSRVDGALREIESDPKSVLIYAAEHTKATGSSTILVASLYGGVLRVSNFGDCGFVVVRGSAVVAKSEPMEERFNYPYQVLCTCTGDDPRLDRMKGHDPTLAQVYDVEVQKDDVVVCGSDGIWDNLFEEQIIETVCAVREAGGGPEDVAKQLIEFANKRGCSSEGSSPFSIAYNEHSFYEYVGGKLDDCTVVVSYVTQ